MDGDGAGDRAGNAGGGGGGGGRGDVRAAAQLDAQSLAQLHFTGAAATWLRKVGVTPPGECDSSRNGPMARPAPFLDVLLTRINNQFGVYTSEGFEQLQTRKGAELLLMAKSLLGEHCAAVRAAEAERAAEAASLPRTPKQLQQLAEAKRQVKEARKRLEVAQFLVQNVEAEHTRQSAVTVDFLTVLPAWLPEHAAALLEKNNWKLQAALEEAVEAPKEPEAKCPRHA